MRSARPVAKRALSVILLTALPVLATACTTTTERAPAAAVVAQLSVDRFLEAANQRDLITMGRTFGTEDGPMSDTGGTFGCFFKKIGSWFGGSPCRTQQDVQVQMAAIADILRYDDYKITKEEPVAGRMNDATRIYVDFTMSDRQVKNVPFVVVRAGNGQWLVENVDLKKVMGSG